MAGIIALSTKPVEADLFRDERMIGAESGIVVRTRSRVGSPHGLIVVLDATFEGCATVASVPAGELEMVDTVAHSIFATLEAAEITWSMRKMASR